MAVYTIPFTGIIGAPESEEDTDVYFSLQDLAMHLHNAASFDTINIAINSKGGYCDVADKMIDLIYKTGKQIITCNTGIVASAASKIFTMANKEARFYYPERGEFLIHNPWVSGAEGDASELASIAKSLKETENDYAKWYAKQTGTDVNIITALMAENTPLTTEQIGKLGFAIIKEKTAIQAVAYLKSNKNMDEKKLEKLESAIKEQGTILSQIKAFFKGKIKAIMLTDGSGNELEFPDLTDVSEIAVGVKVNIAGAAATGEYTQPDGSIIKAENGIVTEITPANGDMAALKKQIEDLQAQLEASRAEVTAKSTEATQAMALLKESEKSINSIRTEFSDFKFKAQTNTPKTGTEGDKGVSRIAFKKAK